MQLLSWVQETKAEVQFASCSYNIPVKILLEN